MIDKQRTLLKSQLINPSFNNRRQANSVMRPPMNISVDHTGAIEIRNDQVKTANEGKRIGLASKLKEGKSAFGNRNYSLALPNEKRANSNLR